MESLPSLPETYLALCRAASDPLSSVSEITRIIEMDPAISVRLLQLVNSAFFGVARRTTSIPKAVSILGTNLLKSLVLSAHMCNAMELHPTRSFSMSAYQNYAIRVGRLARRLAGSTGLGDDAFTAGMMLGIGQIVLALQEPALFEQVLGRVALSSESQHQVERELMGTTHSEIGAFVLSTWGIPFSIVESVAFSYCPNLVGPGDCKLIALVHAAEALTGIVECNEPEDKLDQAFLVRAGFAAELPQWRRLAEGARDP
jgi:HD-like signal output (HDOD) protein